MPTRFADDSFDPGAVKAMMAAFDRACQVLGLVDRSDPLTENLAKIVVQQARSGERDPDKLCAMALKAVGR
jgi:hypothetical protein